MHLCLTVECITSGLHLSVVELGQPPPPTPLQSVAHRHEALTPTSTVFVRSETAPRIPLHGPLLRDDRGLHLCGPLFGEPFFTWGQGVREGGGGDRGRLSFTFGGRPRTSREYSAPDPGGPACATAHRSLQSRQGPSL